VYTVVSMCSTETAILVRNSCWSWSLYLRNKIFRCFNQFLSLC